VARSYTIRRLDLTDTEWKPVVVPMHASGFTIENTGVSVLLIRTDEESDHYRRLVAGGQHVVGSVVATFDPGETVCWLQSVSGPGSAIVDFVR
jgi:hypothetical protein